MKMDGKVALVTGGAGFIGSHLVEELLDNGVKTRVLVHYDSSAGLGWLRGFENREGLEIVRGDIRDIDSCHSLAPDVTHVFHLAALISVPYSYVSPDANISANAIGTLNLLQSFRNSSLENFVMMSTSEVYGGTDGKPLKEDIALNPKSPYAASKASAEMICNAFKASYAMPITVARTFNTYGPRQSTRAVIPVIIKQALEKRGEVKLGALDPKRDLVFVKDTAQALIELASNENVIGNTVNIGTGKCYSIRELIGFVGMSIGVDLEPVLDETKMRPEKSEVNELLADVSRMTELTGWQSKTDIQQGISETVDFWSEKLANSEEDEDLNFI